MSDPTAVQDPLSARVPRLLGDRAALVGLCGICALAAWLRILAFHGFVGSDDAVYAQLADALASGTYPWTSFEGPPVFVVRLGLIAPVALLVHAFGASETVLLSYPFATSMLGIVLAFGVGRHIFGNLAGLISASLAAALPLDLMMATHLTPDPSAAFWTNLGTLLVLLALGAGRRRLAALGLVAGLCFGVAWMHKVNVVYQAPLIAGTLLLSLRRRPELGRTFIGVALGAAVFVVGEALFYAALTGEPLYRLQALGRNFEHTRFFWFVEGGKYGWAPGEYAAALMQRLFVSGPDEILFRGYYGYYPLLGLVALAFGAWLRDRRYVFCGAWLLLLVLLFNFGTTSFEYYRPLILFRRYLYPTLLPAMVLIAGTIAILFEGGIPGRDPIRPRPFPLAVAGVAVVGLLLVSPVSAQLGRDPALPFMREAVQLVLPSEHVYTDARSVTDMQLLWGFPKYARIEPFETLAPGAFEAGALVVVNYRRLGMMRQLYGTKPPAFVSQVPLNWVPEHRLAQGVIYRVVRRPPAR